MSTKTHYRTAYVVEEGRWSFAALEEIADNIVFMTGPSDRSLSQVRNRLSKALENYDPEQDVLVPVGRVVSAWILADMVAHHKKVNIALFTSPHYGAPTIGHYDVIDLHRIASQETGTKEPETS